MCVFVFFNAAVCCFTPADVMSDLRLLLSFSLYRHDAVSSLLYILHLPFDAMFTLRHRGSGPTLISWCLSNERKFFSSQTQDRSHILWPITVHEKHTYSNRKTFGLCVSLDDKFVVVVVFFCNTFNLFKAGNNRRLLKDE